MDTNEMTRLLLNLLRKGAISAVDHAAKKCRVSSGDLVTNWVPWLALRAGSTRTWNPPTVGEQVLLFCPGGDPADGVALCGIYSDDAPAPSANANEDSTHYPDGAVITYDHGTHALTATLPGGGTAVITAPASVTVKTAALTLDAPETICKGNLTVEQKLTYLGGMSGTGGAVIADDVAVNGKSFLEHKHREMGDGADTSAPL